MHPYRVMGPCPQCGVINGHIFGCPRDKREYPYERYNRDGDRDRPSERRGKIVQISTCQQLSNGNPMLYALTKHGAVLCWNGQHWREIAPNGEPEL